MIDRLTQFLMYQTPLFYWTQSLWRDEAFSVWIAQDGILEAVKRTSGDFNPPLYYLLLHLWMRVFGRSEVALRGLSVAAFLLFLIVVLKFSHRIFRSEKAAEFITLLMAVNPMLVYFAFELRMYSLFILFTALSMSALYFKNWVWYIIWTTLGLYTQPFMALVLVAQSGYLLLQKLTKTAIRNALVIGLLYLPWVPTLISQFRASGPMWMYPVDFNMALSALGNLYLGYEGTPGNLWLLMWIISVFFIIIGIAIWKRKSGRKLALFFFTWIGIPLTLVLGISQIKPIYVHRYVIFITVGEVLLLGYFITQIKNRLHKRIVAVSLLTLTFLANFLAVSFHRKVDIRDTFTAVLPLMGKNDVIYAGTPLVYYESLYYTAGNVPVYLYNPYRITPPRYVGSGGMPPEVWVSHPPAFPRRAFMILEDGQFRLVSQVARK